MKTLLIPLGLALAATFAATTKKAPREISPPSPETVADFKLSPHYQKVILLEGFPVVASEKVHDSALHEAATIIEHMLKNRPDILWKLAANKIRLGIMSIDERTTDLPEHSDLAPPQYWNKRARGLGATKERPAVSVGEENLLHNPGDPYKTESIMIHEFAHAIHLMAVNELDPTFDARLEKIYKKAMATGLWKDKYAAQNSREYFAEGVQSWFGTNRENDHDHNHVNTRQELIAYDPALANVVAEVFGENDYTYVRADHPSRQQEAHLKDLKRDQLVPFTWTEKELAEYEKISENGELKK